MTKSYFKKKRKAISFPPMLLPRKKKKTEIMTNNIINLTSFTSKATLKILSWEKWIILP